LIVADERGILRSGGWAIVHEIREQSFNKNLERGRIDTCRMDEIDHSELEKGKAKLSKYMMGI
jgi:hypothetical protein